MITTREDITEITVTSLFRINPISLNGPQLEYITVFFQNEKILVQLDELDKLDIITHAQIGFN